MLPTPQSFNQRNSTRSQAMSPLAARHNLGLNDVTMDKEVGGGVLLIETFPHLQEAEEEARDQGRMRCSIVEAYVGFTTHIQAEGSVSRFLPSVFRIPLG